MVVKREGNVIQFPVKNVWVQDVSDATSDLEGLPDKVKQARMAYFSAIGDEVADNIVRSLASLKLDERNGETFPLDSRDIVMFKECVISALCRVIGMDHPLHKIEEENIVITQSEDDAYDGFFGYRFKSDLEAEEAAEGK